MPGQATTIDTMLRETGVTPSRKLAVALDTWAAATPDTPDRVDVHAECMTVTADGVTDLIERATMQHVIRTNVLPSEAFATVANLLDRRVSREFVADPVMGKVFTRYGAMFDTQAQLLTDAEVHLPSVLDVTHAANGSPETLAAWAVARDACIALDHLRSRRNMLADWGIRASGIDPRLEQATRFTMFDDRATIDQVLAVTRVTPFGTWVPLLRLPDVRLHWSTLDEQAALARRYADGDAALAASKVAEGQAASDASRDAWLRPGADTIPTAAR